MEPATPLHTELFHQAATNADASGALIPRRCPEHGAVAVLDWFPRVPIGLRAPYQRGPDHDGTADLTGIGVSRG